MSIKVRYFASLKEIIGRSEDELHVTGNISVNAIWGKINNIEIPKNTLVAVNMEYVDFNHSATDGDEVAFFPPVTGG